MIKHYKRRTFSYYAFWCVLLLAAAGAAVWKIPEFVSSFKHIDTEVILNKSELKDKKFTAKVQEIQNDGIKAYLLSEHSNPLISLSFSFRRAGSAYEPEHRQGMLHLAEELLKDGAGEYDKEQFADLLDENGIHLNFSADDDDFSGTMVFPAANKNMAVKLLKAALTAPRFEEMYFQKAQQKMLILLKLKDENPEIVLADGARKYIFGGHPYSRVYLGTQEGVNSATAEELRDFMRRHFSRADLIAGIAGDITSAEAENMLAEIFAGLPEKSDADKLPEFGFAAEGREYTVSGSAAQAFTVLFSAGAARSSADFYPLYMANYIFGESGLSSRLSKNIREKEGLTYGVYTYLSNRDAVSLLNGYFSATPENFLKAKEMLKSEWLKMGKNGVSEKELAEAKKALITSFNLRFAEMDNISDMLVAMQKYNLGKDFLDKRNGYIAGVTLHEVNAAAKKYFSTLPDFVNLGTVNSEEK